MTDVLARHADCTPACVIGVITTRDVLAHFPLIWREFGARCALRCAVVAVTRRRTTFLQLIR